jgi:thymidylate synthase
METLNEQYRTLLTTIYKEGVKQLNSRTETEVLTHRGSYNIKLELNGRLPLAANRAYFPKVAAAEVAWQIMGTKNPEFILKHAPKLWSKFVEDGELKTAYGYRWRKHFGRDQLAQLCEELKLNPSNRQLYVSTWDPASDGLGGSQPKNIPCPVGFSVNVLDNKQSNNRELHMSVFIRSSDVFVGLPYDIMAYALTLDALASEVDLVPGTISFTLANAHIYQPHLAMVEACIPGSHHIDKRYKYLKSQFSAGSDLSIPKHLQLADLVYWPYEEKDWPTVLTEIEPSLPGMSISEIENNPEGYINLVNRLSKRVTKNSWSPLPVLVE